MHLVIGPWPRHFPLTISPFSRRLSDPNLCREGSSIPSFSARWRIAFSLRHRRFEIAAILSPDTAAARSWPRHFPFTFSPLHLDFGEKVAPAQFCCTGHNDIE
jgi:hypothetical protein